MASDAPLSHMTNLELLAQADAVLLEVELRLENYQRVGPDLLEMADEGIALASRIHARVEQTQSIASKARGRLDCVGIGGWSPSSRYFGKDPRLGAQGDGERRPTGRASDG